MTPMLALFAQSPKFTKRFNFSVDKPGRGYEQVLTDIYSKEKGYGFEPGRDIMCGDTCGSDKPFYFSVAVPEGNYRVTVTLGSLDRPTNTTIKAELRRLIIEKQATKAGKFVQRSFIVNVRTPQITGSTDDVRLKDCEKTMEWWAWDEKLTLEFNGENPSIKSLVIESVDAPTIFLLGDSTVCDQPLEPYSSWGQMLPRFFDHRIAVANHAQSGESLRSSFSAKRLDKVLSLIKPGDYVFIQFGHNDMKERGEGIGAFTSYLTDLKKYVSLIRAKAGIPILITPVQRRTFYSDSKITNSHGDYPEAVRRAAREEKVPLIDLHQMSAEFYEALGPEKSKLAFKDGDGTHHNNYGAYQLAKFIAKGIKDNKLGISKNLIKNLPIIDPSIPDPVETFYLAPSPLATETKPLGN